MFNLPVTIVAGYLGSGKTHYINTLLSQADGLRYAVLVNDFGELNIDVELIQSSDAKSISLANGCVCCSIANDLDAALDNISSIADTIDWVLLEASGVADARRIQGMVENWPGFELAKTITLVDVTRIKKLATDKYVGAHINNQLAQAELIRFSKTDLINQDELTAVSSWVKAKNCLQAVDQAPYLHPDYFSATYYSENSWRQQDVETWLNQLSDNIIRVKGFVLLQEQEQEKFVYLVQWVDGIWSLQKYQEFRAGMQTKLVLISKQKIDQDQAIWPQS